MEEKMTEREFKLLLNANALKHIQVHYAVMAQGHMIVADGNPLETARRETVSRYFCRRLLGLSGMVRSSNSSSSSLSR